ncbi:hypothetical protein Hanom_Chr04g00360961 [Helianthus anomalus]
MNKKLYKDSKLLNQETELEPEISLITRFLARLMVMKHKYKCSSNSSSCSRKLVSSFFNCRPNSSIL